MHRQQDARPSTVVAVHGRGLPTEAPFMRTDQIDQLVAVVKTKSALHANR